MSRLLPVVLVTMLLAACAGPPAETTRAAGEVGTVKGYGVLQDGAYTLPAVPAKYLEKPNRRTIVYYTGPEAPGTIVVDPWAKFLYLVGDDGTAIRYPIAVGREGRGFRRNAVIGDMREWPGWTPTANMLRSEPEVYGPFRGGIPGGLASPLGARALYLYRGGADTRYRIHGTNDLEAIGNAGTAGCIRLFNHDIIDLYGRVTRGTPVVVRSYEESVRLEGEDFANRGIELPARIVPPEDIAAALAAAGPAGQGPGA
ncbi:MAG: L,D-transpeptidase [Rhodobacteraceae bacterium]|nr:L,D-transpeptidase [Paracoccaceae bacterium]